MSTSLPSDPHKYLYQLCFLLSGLFLIGFSREVFAQQYEMSEDTYKQITKSCLQSMSRKVVQPQVSMAYCYCYTEELSKLFTEEDFSRIGIAGPSDRDQQFFKTARKRCRPSKSKQKSF